MMIDISAEPLQRANAALRGLPGALPRVLSLATNRTLEGLRTDAASETKKRYHAKASDIRKTLTLKKASAGKLTTTMLSRGPRRSLAAYKLIPSSPSKGGKWLMGAVKTDGLKPLKNAFLVGRGGQYKPYIRIGSGKNSIEPVISPSIPQIVKNEETVAAMEKGASERFEKRLDHEILRLLGAFK